jgi:hypothetical protein
MSGKHSVSPRCSIRLCHQSPTTGSISWTAFVGIHPLSHCSTAARVAYCGLPSCSCHGALGHRSLAGLGNDLDLGDDLFRRANLGRRDAS